MFSLATSAIFLAAALSVFASPLSLEKRAIDPGLLTRLSMHVLSNSSNDLDSPV